MPPTAYSVIDTEGKVPSTSSMQSRSEKGQTHQNAPSFEDLPDEVLRIILSYLQPAFLPCIEQISKRFQLLATDEILWRDQCHASFTIWNPERKIQVKFKEPIGAIRWKDMFVSRQTTDRMTTRLLDSILETQRGRISKFHKVVKLGYETKETLLRHMQVDDSAEDVLCRRFYAKAALGHLHRTIAVREWMKLNDESTSRDTSLERVLGAFDMFLFQEKASDFDDISKSLDGIASLVRTEAPNLHGMTTREKALTVVRVLQKYNFIGVEEHLTRALRNNFIGFALRDEKHPSLPLVSVGIFCAVSQRLNIDARPCAFPFHVHAIIVPQEGFTLDCRPMVNEASTILTPQPQAVGSNMTDEEHVSPAIDRDMISQTQPNGVQQTNRGDREHTIRTGSNGAWRTNQQDREMTIRAGLNDARQANGKISERSSWMYLDPFSSADEVSLQSLTSQLRAIGSSVDDDEQYLSPASNRDMTIRTGLNIIRAVQAVTARGAGAVSLQSKDSAFYAATWALTVLSGASLSGSSPAMIAARRKQYITHLITQLQTHFPSDICLVEQYLLPFFSNHEEYPSLEQTIQAIYSTDRMPKEIKSRGSDEADQYILYKVGQVFRHRTQRYLAVVTGWDYRCAQDEDWIAYNGVDRLPKGRNQTFYHALAEDNIIRYVANENITFKDIPAYPDVLMSIAGRYFKRWDADAGKFTSNIRDEYPDD